MKDTRMRTGIAILMVVLMTCALMSGWPAHGPVVASSVVSTGGWAWQNPLPTGNDLKGVWGSSASNVYAIGKCGTILRYNGSSWVSLACGTTVTLYGVWGSSPNNVYAVGENGTILLYSGTAVTWTPLASGTTNCLYAVWGSSAGDVYVVGDGGTILHSTDGTSWSPMSSGTPYELNSVWGSAAGNVFAVGDFGTIRRFDGVGSTWTDMASNIDISHIFLYGVWGSSASNVYAVGEGGTIMHYDGTGLTWSAVSSGSSSWLQGVWGSSAGDVFAVGSGGTILHSTDGILWSPLSSGSSSWLQGVWGSAAGIVFSVGKGGTILHTANGSTWGAMSSSRTAGTLNAVWASPSGVNTYAVGDSGTILRCTDKSTWNVLNSGSTSYLYGVWAYGSGTGTAYAVGSSGTILHSSDGVSWTPQTTGVGGGLTAVWGASPTYVYAVGAYGVVLRTTNGSDWDALTSGTGAWLRGVWGGYSNIYAVGSGGTIMHCTDNTSWNPLTSGTTVNLNGVWGSWGKNIYVVGDNGTILHSTDGTSWTALTSGTTRDLKSVWGSDGVVYAVGQNGTILRSTDGTSWSPLPSGTTNYLNGVWGVGGYVDDVYVVGNFGTILHGPELPSDIDIDPTRASQGQSLAVTITGSHLEAAAALDFGPGITVDNFTIDSSTQITARISIALDAPPSPPLRDVSVITAAGTGTMTGAFDVVPLPLITFVGPAQAARGQTLNVTITGTHFTAATVVAFGAGVTVNSFSAASDTQITGSITIAADASPGARNVSVTTAAGTGTGVGAFTVVAPPVVSSVSPGQGAKGQTISITVRGSYFTGATAVAFGAGIAVDNFTAAGDTQITASVTIASDAALGARDVSVTTPVGTGTKAGSFTVLEPSAITAVSPSQAAQGQTVTVTITGSRLTGATAVSFGSGITVDSLSVASDTQMTAAITIVSDAALGARDVSVTTPGGTFVKAPAFTVLPLPVITSISPTQAAQGQTITVTISGSHLTGATAVGFGAGTTVASLSVVSDTQITASITIASDATVGVRDVSVTTPNGTGTKAVAFKVLLMPVIAMSGGSLVETSDRSPSFQGTITDPEGLVDAVQYCVDDSPSWQDGGFTRDATDPGKGSYSFVTSLTSGDHTVHVRSVDAAGNVVGSVADISVTVEKGGSKVWVIVLVLVMVAAIAGVAGYLIWRYRGKTREKSTQKVGETKQKLEQ